MQSHRYSFFGQKTGMVLSARDWTDPWVTLTFIKKREQGSGSAWEKFPEGKTIKLSLVELAAILAVVRGEKPAFKTYHKFKGDGTPIEVRYERGRGAGEPESVVFSAGGYVRPVAWPETEVLLALLKHIFAEKIQHATGSPTEGPAISGDDSQEDETSEGDQALPLAQKPAPTQKSSQSDPHGSFLSAPANFTTKDSNLSQQFRALKFRRPPANLPTGSTTITGDLYGLEENEIAPLVVIDKGNGELLEIPSERVLYGTLQGETVQLVLGKEFIPETQSSQDPHMGIPIPVGNSAAGGSVLEPKSRTFIPDGILARANGVVR